DQVVLRAGRLNQRGRQASERRPQWCRSGCAGHGRALRANSQTRPLINKTNAVPIDVLRENRWYWGTSDIDPIMPWLNCPYWLLRKWACGNKTAAVAVQHAQGCITPHIDRSA